MNQVMPDEISLGFGDEPATEKAMMQLIEQRTHSFSQQRLLLLLLLMAIVLLNLPATGFVRFGGGDDEGSGLGGTGRTAIPGSESGLGGTGFKPFLGYTAPVGASESDRPAEVVIYHRPEAMALAVSKSVQADIPATRPVTAAPLPSPVTVMAASNFTRDSSAILIHEQIQREMDEMALSFADDETLQQQVAATPAPSAHTITSSAENSDTQPAAASLASQLETQDEVSWQALGNYLADQRTAKTSEEGESELAALSTELLSPDLSSEANQRMSRPDRVQRPELPTMQRVRPVQRAGVLPPRIQPFKL